MAPKGKKHQFEDCPPVAHRREGGFAEVPTEVNNYAVGSPHVNTQPGNDTVVEKVQKIMYPTFGQGTSDGPNLYDSTTDGKNRNGRR